MCVEGGKLRITARKQERDGHAYTSAKLTTAGKADWQYGKVQVRAKLPKGKGSRPAIWMMPNDRRGDVDWRALGKSILWSMWDGIKTEFMPRSTAGFITTGERHSEQLL